MKKLVLIVSLMLSTAAQADQVPAWQLMLEQYKVSLDQSTNAGLRVRYGFYSGMALGTWTLNVAVVDATFVTHTLAVTNILGETVANISSPHYQTYQNILEWENLGSIGRGAIGGAPVALLESLQFIGLWLGGNEALAWEQVAKTY